MNDVAKAPSQKGHLLIYLLTCVIICALYYYFMKRLVEKPSGNIEVHFPQGDGEGIKPGEPPRANGTQAGSMSVEPGQPPRAKGS